MTVGALVAAASAMSGAGLCAAPTPEAGFPSGPSDQVCYHLVRTLAERAGLATAALTAVIALTFIGLFRLATRGERGAELTDRVSP